MTESNVTPILTGVKKRPRYVPNLTHEAELHTVLVAAEIAVVVFNDIPHARSLLSIAMQRTGLVIDLTADQARDISDLLKHQETMYDADTEALDAS